MYLHSLFTTKENNKTEKNVFTIYVYTEVEIIVLKLWKKSNFQYRFAKLTVISAYRSICLLSQHTHLCLSDGPVPMLVQYKYC